MGTKWGMVTNYPLFPINLTNYPFPDPRFSLEWERIELCLGPVVGVDEAGRGPLAGPVTAAAVILDKENLNWQIADSKKLTGVKRAELADWIKGNARSWAIGWASVEEIDKANILQATFLAMKRALEQLNPTPKSIFVDGNQKIPGIAGSSAIISGDSICLSISAASILAKTARDEYMTHLHSVHPEYHFNTNFGYATAEHIRAVYEHGTTPHHRRSFRIPQHPDNRIKS